VEPDLVSARAGLLVEQCLRSHDHAGRADPALQPAAVHEGPLQRMQPTILRESFDGLDLRADGLQGEHQATVDRPTVDQHGAGAALAVAAAFLGTGQADAIAEGVEQPGARLDHALTPLAVDHQLNDLLHRRPSALTAAVRSVRRVNSPTMALR